MKENEILTTDEIEVQQGEQLEQRPHRHWDILAVLLCLLLAFGVWLCVMNMQDTDYIPLELSGTKAGMHYALSEDGVTVEGAVCDLKDLSRIEVVVPEEATAPGTYRLDIADLKMPDGIYLTGELRLVLTVTD